MTTVEFDLERTIAAPIDQVFARLADIEGHNDWMPKKGTLLKHTRQTSPGPPDVGTTYIDESRFGPDLPGEIVEFAPPHTIVYHWWEKSKSGKVTTEGWPGYHLTPAAEGATHVRHHAKLNLYGPQRMAKPVFRLLAVRERTVTLEALKRSFEHEGRPATG
jgi:uncharacterized protein YndB with AHSA1/START domain